MRCFIAINLPDRIKNKIAEITKELPDKGIKKVKPNNLHLTLKFLGEVSENNADKIKKILDKIDYQKFDVSLKNFGFFPNNNFIKIVWIGIEKGREEIIKLQKQIDLKLKELNFKPETDFEPHLTIARVKFLEDKKEFFEKTKKFKFEENFSVSNFCLMQSFLKNTGPIYKKIHEVKLS